MFIDKPPPTRWLEGEWEMSNCSDIGLQGSSPRDARFMQFIAKGPGIAGFKFDVDPEIDGDVAAQFLAHADKARVEERDLAVDSHHPKELSFEALTDLGVEFADPDAGGSIQVFEDWDELRDLPVKLIAQFDESGEEGETLSGVPAKYLRERQLGTVEVFHSEAMQVMPRRKPGGAPRFNTEARCRGLVEVARFVGRHLAKAEAARKADEASTVAKSEPTKGNGHKPVPPVGKYLAGTGVSQGFKGLLVDIGNGREARVRIADEYGHGSWAAAAAWVLGFKPGTNVRIKVIRRVNGVIEAVLADRHPRPWQRRGQDEQQARRTSSR
ncbi:MAG: hypothetical protein AAB579_01905 [Patescibacteria group bacterium]